MSTVAPQFFRTSALRQAPARGVDTQAQIIRGAKVIQLGDINDSRPWTVDQQTLAQVVQFGNQPNKGLKARFTHPNMSDDGLGKYLGRWQDFRVEGDSVLADLHISASAKSTPGGDLAQYVLDLVQEDPGALGVSVVMDLAPEMYQQQEPGTKQPLRMTGLRAADVVDEPAATRGGMFDLQSPAGLPALATWIVETHFADREPAEVVNRLGSFLSKYYGRDIMSELTAEKAGQGEQQTKAPEAPAVSLENAKPYIESFGDRGAKWFLEGKPMVECFQIVTAELTEQLGQKDLVIQDLEAKLQAALAASGEEPLSTSPPVAPLDADKAAKQQKASQLAKQGLSPTSAKWAASFSDALPKAKR